MTNLKAKIQQKRGFLIRFRFDYLCFQTKKSGMRFK